MRRCLFALLVLLGPAAAHALTMCTDPAASDGDSADLCSSWSYDASFALMADYPDTLYLVCRGSSLGLSGPGTYEPCVDAGGSWVVARAGSLSGSDLLHEWYFGEERLGTWDLSLGTGGPPLGNGEFGISDLDLAKCGRIFAAGFLIVGISWAIGKGVSTILSVVKH